MTPFDPADAHCPLRSIVNCLRTSDAMMRCGLYSLVYGTMQQLTLRSLHDTLLPLTVLTFGNPLPSARLLTRPSSSAPRGKVKSAPCLKLQHARSSRPPLCMLACTYMFTRKPLTTSAAATPVPHVAAQLQRPPISSSGYCRARAPPLASLALPAWRGTHACSSARAIDSTCNIRCSPERGPIAAQLVDEAHCTCPTIRASFSVPASCDAQLEHHHRPAGGAARLRTVASSRASQLQHHHRDVVGASHLLGLQRQPLCQHVAGRLARRRAHGSNRFIVQAAAAAALLLGEQAVGR